MADQIEINIAVLKRDIEEMKAEAAILKKLMEDTYSQVRELDSMWDGPSNEAFNQAFRADHEQFKGLLETIDGLISYMERARDEYLRCEAAVSRQVDEIRV